MPIEQLCEVMDRLAELDNDFEEMKLDILEIFPLEDAFFAMFAYGYARALQDVTVRNWYRKHSDDFRLQIGLS